MYKNTRLAEGLNTCENILTCVHFYLNINDMG